MNTEAGVSQGLSPVWVPDNRCAASGMTRERWERKKLDPTEPGFAVIPFGRAG